MVNDFSPEELAGSYEIARRLDVSLGRFTLTARVVVLCGAEGEVQGSRGSARNYRPCRTRGMLWIRMRLCRRQIRHARSHLENRGTRASPKTKIRWRGHEFADSASRAMKS